MVIIKGRLWQEGRWRAELSDLQLVGKGETKGLAFDGLDRQLKELAPNLGYELDEQADGSLLMRTDNAVGLAFLILQRRIAWK